MSCDIRQILLVLFLGGATWKLGERAADALWAALFGKRRESPGIKPPPRVGG